MKRISCIILLCAISADANPFAKIWNRVMGRTVPPGVVDCVIQKYDPVFGPLVEKKHWNVPCVLESEVSAMQLRNVKDPAGFLNARFEAVSPPTPAVWIDSFTGRQSPANPLDMATGEQAQKIHQRLDRLSRDWYLNAPCGLPREGRPQNPFSRIDYRDDPRRHWYVGTMSVGRVRATFADLPSEAAERALLAEIGAGACE